MTSILNIWENKQLRENMQSRAMKTSMTMFATQHSGTESEGRPCPSSCGQVVALRLMQAALLATIAGTAPSPPPRHTVVSIVGEEWLINGEPTFKGRKWDGVSMQYVAAHRTRDLGRGNSRPLLTCRVRSR